MKTKIAQVIGLNTDQKAALALSSQREDGDIFLAVLDISCDDAFTRGRQVLNELSDEFFDGEESVSLKLNSAFTNIQTKLSDVSAYDLLLASVSGKVLYLIFNGDVAAYLKRGTISSLLDIGSPKQLISGFLEEGDRVLLSTSSLSTFLGDDFKKTFELPLSEWEEAISAKVGVENTNSHGLAGLILEVEVENPIEIPKTMTGEEPVGEFIRPSLPKMPKFDLKAINPSRFFKFFPRSGRSRLILGLILLLVVGAGVGLQYKRGKDAENTVVFNQYLQQAKDDFSVAEGLKTLNPGEAKNKLDSAKQSLDKALAVKSNDPEALELKNRLAEGQEQVLKQFEASSFDLFLDLDLVKKGFSAESMSLSNGRLLVLDPSSKTLATINMDKKSQEIISGKEELGEAGLASINEGMAVAYSSDKGVLKVDVNNQKVTVVSKVDKEWGDIKDVAGFGSNIYLLDSGTGGQIWKYLPTSSGYSDKREYLTPTTKIDFTGAKKMRIESSIYVLKEGGEILRFTKGASDHFSIGGLDRGIKDPKSFFTSSEVDNVYILDSGNSRLVVVNKTGGYVSQYQGDKFGSSSDLAVDEKGKKVYLLEGSKIYSMDLK